MQASHKFRKVELYDFDRMLMVPQYSKIKSRSTIDLSTIISRNPRTGKEFKLTYPIIAANMSTVSGELMVETMHNLGGAAFLHRYMTHESIYNICSNMVKKGIPIIPSLGIGDASFAGKLYDELGIDT